MEVRAVSDRLSDLGEGPHWDVNLQKLYYVDAFVGDVCLLDPKTGGTEARHFDGVLTTFVIPYLSDSSHVVISLTRQVKKLNFHTGEIEHITSIGSDTERFNDGKCDVRGRLWAGTLVEGQAKKGKLYKLEDSNTLSPYSDQISLSNGMTWSLDNQTMYFIDSEEKKIYAFDYDQDQGVPSNRRLLLDYNTNEDYAGLGVPDGMTIDIEGKLWVACFGGGCVLRIDPQTATILKKVDIPCLRVTSCCWGGPHFDTLYVTTAQRNEPQLEPKAGAVFAVTGLGTRGQPPAHFKG